MKFALDNPNSLHRLVVVDIMPTAYSAKRSRGVTEYVQAVRLLDENMPRDHVEALRKLEASFPDKMVREHIVSNLVADPANPERLKWKINSAAITEWLPRLLENDVVGRHPSSEVPLLLLGGSKVSYVTERRVPEVRRLFPKLTVHLLPTGHWVHYEEPHQFLQLVSKFLVEN